MQYESTMMSRIVDCAVFVVGGSPPDFVLRRNMKLHQLLDNV